MKRKKWIHNNKRGNGDGTGGESLWRIAIILGLIFKNEITNFVNKTFESLNSGF